MSTAEIRLDILDRIMHMSEEQLLEIYNLFEDKPLLTKEQDAELKRRVDAHESSETQFHSFKEVQSKLDSKFG